MTREADALFHREVEDCITYMLLCERGFGVGKMEFFDGATLGFGELVESLWAESGIKDRSDTACGQLADRLPKVGGSVVLSGDDGVGFCPCGARELGMVAKQKLADRSPGSMSFRQHPESGRGFTPHFREEGNELVYRKIDPTLRIVEVRAVSIAPSGEATRVLQNYFI